MKRSTAVLFHHSSRFTEQLIQRWNDLDYHLIYTGSIHPRHTVHQQTMKRVDVPSLFDEIRDHHRSIDYLLINYDHRLDYRAAIEEFPLEQWRAMIEKHLIHSFQLVQTVWPKMKRQHFGRIFHLVNDKSRRTIKRSCNYR